MVCWFLVKNGGNWGSAFCEEGVQLRIGNWIFSVGEVGKKEGNWGCKRVRRVNDDVQRIGQYGWIDGSTLINYAPWFVIQKDKQINIQELWKNDEKCSNGILWTVFFGVRRADLHIPGVFTRLGVIIPFDHRVPQSLFPFFVIRLPHSHGHSSQGGENANLQGITISQDINRLSLGEPKEPRPRPHPRGSPGDHQTLPLTRCLQFIDMLHETGKKLLFILNNQPLIDTDEIILVLLASDDLLLQDVGTSQLLRVSEEVPETVELYNHVSQAFPFGDHHVADEVVEVVLHEAGDSQGFHDLKGLVLDVRGVGLEGEVGKGGVDLLAEVVDLGEGGTQVEVAVVEIHGLVQGHLLGLGQVTLYQGVQLAHLPAIEDYAHRPDQPREMARSEQVLFVEGDDFEDGKDVLLKLRDVEVEDSDSIDNVHEGCKGEGSVLVLGFLPHQFLNISPQGRFHQSPDHRLIVVLRSPQGRGKLVEVAIIQAIDILEERGEGHLVEFIEFIHIYGPGVQIGLYFRQTAQHSIHILLVEVAGFVEDGHPLGEFSEEVLVDVLLAAGEIVGDEKHLQFVHVLYLLVQHLYTGLPYDCFVYPCILKEFDEVEQDGRGKGAHLLDDGLFVGSEYGDGFLGVVAVDDFKQGDHAFHSFFLAQLQALISDVVMQFVQLLTGDFIDAVDLSAVVKQTNLIVVHCGVIDNDLLEVGLICREGGLVPFLLHPLPQKPLQLRVGAMQGRGLQALPEEGEESYGGEEHRLQLTQIIISAKLIHRPITGESQGAERR